MQFLEVFNYVKESLNEFDSLLLHLMEGKEIYFYIVITVIVMKIKENSKNNLYCNSLTYLVGTFFHELSHYIVAIITTFNIPKNFILFPKEIEENGKKWFVLGSVDINSERLNIFNSFLIGFAPLFLLLLSYLTYEYFFEYYLRFFTLSFIAFTVYVFLIVTFVINSIPSSADLKVARKYGSIYLWILIITIIYTYRNELNNLTKGLI